MSFLTVLIGLLLNHYWLRDRRLPIDNWFVEWQNWLFVHACRLPERMRDWYGTLPLIAILVPLLPLALVLWLADGLLFGLLTLGIHVIVLLYCFTRVNQQALMEQYLEFWRVGDYEAAYLHVNQYAPEAFSRSLEDYAVMHRQFVAYIQETAFRHLFAVLFWYVLLGPIGALAYWLVLALIRNARLLADPDACRLAGNALVLLEWLPARLLAMSYALAGDFVAAFRSLREHGRGSMAETDNLVLLTDCAAAAVGNANDASGDTDASVRAVSGLEALRDLLLRSQVVWVIALALAILVV